MSSNPGIADGDVHRPEILRAFDVIHAELDAHGEAALFGLTDDQIVEALVLREALARRLDALGLGLVRELDGRGVGSRAGSASTALWIRDRVKIRPREAQGRVRLAAAVAGSFRATGHALTTAAMSVDHAQVVVSVVGRIPRHLATVEMRGRVETVLLDVARTVDPGDLAKVGRALLLTLCPDDGDDDAGKRGRRSLSMRDRDDGMTALHAVLDPEGAALVTAALDPLARPRPVSDGQRDPRPAARRRCDALIELCRKTLNDGRLPDTGGVRPHIAVLVPFSTLTGVYHGANGPFGFGGPHSFAATGWRPGTADSRPGGSGPGGSGGRPVMADGGPAYTTHGGVPLPVGVVDRLVCDASVRRVVFGPDSELLDVGRAKRTATPAIRAAVTARDQMCTYPGCDRPPSWTECHHLIPWTANGDTAVDNATPRTWDIGPGLRR